MIDKQFIHERPDEWTESAENEPLISCGCCRGAWPESELENGVCPNCKLVEWDKRQKGDEQCASILQQAAQARLEKPQGHCVRVSHPDGSVWDV